MKSLNRVHLILGLSLLLSGSSALAQELTFNNYRSAMSAAAGLYNSGNLAASKPAFEAAIELATNEREKNDAYSPLVKVYSEAGEFDKMFSAADYVIEHATYDAKASLTIRSLLANCQRKNQFPAFEKRYTARLAADPNDRLGLTLMAEYYGTARRDFAKKAEMLGRLVEVNKDDGRPSDAQLHYDLAFAMKLARQNKEAAELFENTAEMSEDLHTMSLMEAAEAWQRAGDMEKALAAAQKAHDLGPDKKAKLSLYRWHRSLGEVFLAGKQKQEALAQLTQAHEAAPIDAYKKQCVELIEKANAL